MLDTVRIYNFFLVGYRIGAWCYLAGNCCSLILRPALGKARDAATGSGVHLNYHINIVGSEVRFGCSECYQIGP